VLATITGIPLSITLSSLAYHICKRLRYSLIEQSPDRIQRVNDIVDPETYFGLEAIVQQHNIIFKESQ